MIFALLGSPLIILAVHAVLARTCKLTPPQSTAVRAIAAGCAPVGVVLYFSVFRDLMEGEILLAVVYCSIVYISFGYSYFHLFNMSETARRIRILYEIGIAGGLSCHEIGRRYRSSDIIALRLDRLSATGKLTFREGHYYVNSKLLYCAAVLINVWRKILGFAELGVRNG